MLDFDLANNTHSHPLVLAQLRWTSSHLSSSLSSEIGFLVQTEMDIWFYISRTSREDRGGIISSVAELDFRYMPLKSSSLFGFLDFMNWLFESQQVSEKPLQL